ncbi:hypothetical protein BN8_03651 [Fibrisoma limi BUZ 3]|uniref:Prohead serine protease domain-containing protein n=1 Tax=Fibrisoma limi BUZ 3 TaxID=1185876 RepID=I2GKQ1_9BACT|nr:HK97 family phage prohead protease [Fibrisoma limi]CCH54477.1 hypothetical protein BN8_03651 [Fibrisoma limi BUZ 3]
MSKLEKRLYQTELVVEERAADEGGSSKVFFRGMAIVYDKPSRMLYHKEKGPFVEVIERGAVDENTDLAEVLAVFNHDENRLLGANYSGTLRFDKTDEGVSVIIEKPNNTVGNDCEEWVRRGDIRGMSFKFFVAKDRWEMKGEVLHRYVEKISKIMDLSLVTRAAYLQTSVDMAEAGTATTRSMADGPDAALTRGYWHSETKLGPVSDTDKAFLADLITQLQSQIDLIAKAIAGITDNRIKQLAASRLSDAVYVQNWIQEVQAELLAAEAETSGADGAMASAKQQRSATEAPDGKPSEVPTNEVPTNQEPAKQEPEARSVEGDPLEWFKRKNSLHRNSLSS